MLKYRDYMEKEQARKQQAQFPVEDEQISREEIFDILMELAVEEGRIYKIPFDTRDGRRQVLTIDQDGCAVGNGEKGGTRRLPRSAGLRTFQSMTDAEILEQLRAGGTEQEMLDRLIEEAKKRGAPDNVTVVLTESEGRR